MPEETAETQHAITVTGLREHADKEKVAKAIARIAPDVPLDRILKRLESPPWTLTRSATAKIASRVAKLLEQQGAEVEVLPQMEETGKSPAVEEVPGVPPPPVPPEMVIPSGRPSMSPPAPVPARTPSSSGDAVPKKADAAANPPWEMGPLTLGGILDRAFTICRNHFWKLLAIMIVPWVVTVGILAATAGILGIAGLTWRALSQTSMWGLVIVAAMIVPSLLVVVVGVFYLSQGALIHAVSSVHLGREVQVKQSYSFVLSKLAKFVLTSLLFILAIILSVVVALVLGVILFFIFKMITSSGWWSAITWPLLLFIPAYVVPKLLLFDKVVIIEDKAYGQALKRSWNLLTGEAAGSWPRGYWMKLVVLLHIFILINIAVSLLFGPPAAALSHLFPESLRILGQALSQILSSLGNMVASLFASVCLVVFYYDIRNRKEGLDLHMLAESIEKT